MVSSRPHVDLLGGARVDAEKSIDRLEKKTAALLAYLALEGPTGRSRVAGLLWPESRETTARNNLAQVVRRLRTNAGVTLGDGDATLSLTECSVDVVELLAAVQRGDFAAAVALEGELLAGYDYEDCHELEDWLRAARGRARRSFARAAEAEIDRLAAAQLLDDAIGIAERRPRVRARSRGIRHVERRFRSRRVARRARMRADRDRQAAGARSSGRLGARGAPRTLALAHPWQDGRLLEGQAGRPGAHRAAPRGGGPPGRGGAAACRCRVDARGLSRLADGVALFDHAARLYEAEGDLHAASEALYHRARSHMGTDADDVVARLDRYGITDLDKARALLVRANVDLERGRLEGARESATKAYALAEAAGDRLIVTESLQALLDADMRSGRLDEAERTFQLFDAASATMSDDPEAEIAAVYYRAELCCLRDRHRDALTHFQAAVDKLDSWGQLAHGKAGILAQMTRSHLALGEIAAARRTVNEAERLLGAATGAVQALPQLNISRGMLLHAEGDSAGALEVLQRVSAPAHELRLELAARCLTARIRAEQGDIAGAEAELRAISTETRADSRTRKEADATLAYIAARRG